MSVQSIKWRVNRVIQELFSLRTCGHVDATAISMFDVHALDLTWHFLTVFSVTMVMGIPTVKRKVKSYLSETLRSLIDKLSPEEKLDCVIIVFIGEVRSEHEAFSHWIQQWWQKVCESKACVLLVYSLQTDLDYVHSVVAGLEKEWVLFSIFHSFRIYRAERSVCRTSVTLMTPPLCSRFSTELSSGLLEVISPPVTYYPDLNNLKETFGDSKERVR